MNNNENNFCRNKEYCYFDIPKRANLKKQIMIKSIFVTSNLVGKMKIIIHNISPKLWYVF